MPKRTDGPRRRARAGDYTEEHRQVLRTGFDLKLVLAAFKSDGERREAWEALRAGIMKQWLQERPGSRPWAWWQFESPQPRDSRRWRTEREQLEAMGRLTDAEREALERLP